MSECEFDGGRCKTHRKDWNNCVVEVLESRVSAREIDVARLEARIEKIWRKVHIRVQSLDGKDPMFFDRCPCCGGDNRSVLQTIDNAVQHLPGCPFGSSNEILDRMLAEREAEVLGILKKSVIQRGKNLVTDVGPNAEKCVGSLASKIAAMLRSAESRAALKIYEAVDASKKLESEPKRKS